MDGSSYEATQLSADAGESEAAFFYRVSRKTPKTSSCVETFFARPVKKLGQHFFSVYFLTLCFHGRKEKNWIPPKAKSTFPSLRKRLAKR